MQQVAMDIQQVLKRYETSSEAKRKAFLDALTPVQRQEFFRLTLFYLGLHLSTDWLIGCDCDRRGFFALNSPCAPLFLSIFLAGCWSSWTVTFRASGKMCEARVFCAQH